MKYNAKVSAAIVAILSEASAIAYGAAPSDNSRTTANELQEVIVILRYADPGCGFDYSATRLKLCLK